MKKQEQVMAALGAVGLGVVENNIEEQEITLDNGVVLRFEDDIRTTASILGVKACDDTRIDVGANRITGGYWEPDDVEFECLEQTFYVWEAIEYCFTLPALWEAQAKIEAALTREVWDGLQ